MISGSGVVMLLVSCNEPRIDTDEHNVHPVVQIVRQWSLKRNKWQNKQCRITNLHYHRRRVGRRRHPHTPTPSHTKKFLFRSIMSFSLLTCSLLIHNEGRSRGAQLFNKIFSTVRKNGKKDLQDFFYWGSIEAIHWSPLGWSRLFGSYKEKKDKKPVYFCPRWYYS